MAPYAQQLPLGDDVRDNSHSRGADAGISTELEDIAESEEVTCDLVMSATCAPACMEVDAAGVVQTVSFAVDKATDYSEVRDVDNTIPEEAKMICRLILLHQK